jgi:predicted lipoprotein with Yx(FWY)xxD motif
MKVRCDGKDQNRTLAQDRNRWQTPHVRYDRRDMRRLTLRRRPQLAALLAIAGLILAACTGGTGAATPGASAAGGLTVGTASSGLGTFLTGPDGRTLYVFTKDSANTSTCTSPCSDTWLPITVAAGQQPQAGAGVTGQLGTLTRADGAIQVTYNGRPLYHFKGDAKAGDTNGQGIGGFWFVADAAGGAPGSGAPGSGAPGSSASSPPSPPPGGYQY